MGSLVGQFRWGVFRLGSFVWDPPLGIFRLDMSHENFGFEMFARGLAFWICRLGTSDWALPFGIARLRCFAWELSFRIFRLGVFAWELSLGIVRFEIVGWIVLFSLGNFRLITLV